MIACYGNAKALICLSFWQYISYCQRLHVKLHTFALSSALLCKIFCKILLNLNLEDVQLEKPYPGKKVDMYAIDYNTGVEVFIESVLHKSNDSHQKQVLKIINIIKKGIIIYQSLGFKREHIVELREAVKDSGKPISLYFVKLNSDLLLPLERINRFHKLKQYQSLHLLEMENPIQFLERESVIQPIKRSEFIKGKTLDLENREDVNTFLLTQLREKISYYLPFQREKANLDKNRIISVGAGGNSIQFFVSVSDGRGRAFVELRFTGDKRHIFEAIKEKEDVVRERIDEDIVFKDAAIGLYFKPLGNVRETVSRLVEVFEKMIICFANYIYYKDKREMWQYHQEGI